MKAYNLHDIANLKFEEVKLPQIKGDEVLLEVKAAGICGSDIPRIYRNGTYHFPTIPGHEFAGQVVETGVGVDKEWNGKRVGVFPLIPCMKCVPCKKRQYEMCRHYSYLGSRQDGGFAEYVAVPEWNLIELPENVSFEQAAMLEPMAVAVHAMRSIEKELASSAIRSDVSIAIQGLGTIGTLLMMFLLDAGFENIFAIGNKEFQRKMCLNLGIKENNYISGYENKLNMIEKKDKSDSESTISYKYDLSEQVSNKLLELTSGDGVDIFFECVGKNETLNTALMSTAPGGRVQLVGNPYSDIKINRDIYWKILRNQLELKGSWNSTFTHEKDDDWNYVLDRLAAGRIHPEKIITHRLVFRELENGLLVMRDKKEDYIKMMIVK